MTIGTMVPTGFIQEELTDTPSSGANWEKVDDGTTFGDADDSTTRCHGTAPDQIDVHTLSNLGIDTDSTVNSVEHNMRIQEGSLGGAPRDARGGHGISGTGVWGTNRSLGSGWENFSQVLARPGGGGWSVADTDSLEVLFNHDAGAASGNSEVTLLFEDVDYTLPAGGGLGRSLAGAGGLAGLSGLAGLGGGLAA